VPHLTDYLTDSLTGTVIILKGFEYGSFNVILDMISSALDLSTDDISSVFMMYTPLALTDVFGQRAGRELVVGADVALISGGSTPTISPSSGYVQSVFTPVSEAPRGASTPLTENAQPESRLAKFWLIANFSLVVPALIVLGAAVLLFLGAQDEKRVMLESVKDDRTKLTQSVLAERDQLNKSVLQQSIELRAAQYKLLERLDAQTAEFQRHLIDEAKHLREMEEVQADIIKNKAGQEKGTRTSAATVPVAEPTPPANLTGAKR
jgi:hypothetical protein